MPLRRFALFALLPLGGFAVRLAAQDVTVTPLAWVETRDAPDQLPAFKSPLRVEFPAELRPTRDLGYALVRLTLDEKGRILALPMAATQPLIELTVGIIGSINPLTGEMYNGPQAHKLRL